jgi:hypothetical protein
MLKGCVKPDDGLPMHACGPPAFVRPAGKAVWIEL